MFLLGKTSQMQPRQAGAKSKQCRFLYFGNVNKLFSADFQYAQLAGTGRPSPIPRDYVFVDQARTNPTRVFA
ncbi:hypothetical protein J6590_052558 [Homalodisca vitripennis]|nr:hypothetical protein J6590_052558 [Homalodisca vitripennis]